MALKLYRPTTQTRRHSSIIDSSDLTRKKPEKKLTYPKKQSAGRNNTGRITVRHRGGGVKRRIRIVDFKQNRFDLPATIIGIEYDPNRSARLALLEYQDKSRSYIIAEKDMKVGDVVLSSASKAEIKPGNRMPLSFIPAGTMVYSVEINPGSGGVIARSAGSSVVLQSIADKYAQLKMPSGEIRLVSKNCLASIGQVSNIDHSLVRIGKAGRNRRRGIRPSVRGKVMNPCDHPHGGGEGRHSVGMAYPKTKWGKHALGVLTRRPKKWSNKLIVKIRPKGKRK